MRVKIVLQPLVPILPPANTLSSHIVSRPPHLNSFLLTSLQKHRPPRCLYLSFTLSREGFTLTREGLTLSVFREGPLFQDCRLSVVDCEPFLRALSKLSPIIATLAEKYRGYPPNEDSQIGTALLPVRRRSQRQRLRNCLFRQRRHHRIPRLVRMQPVFAQIPLQKSLAVHHRRKIIQIHVMMLRRIFLDPLIQRQNLRRRPAVRHHHLLPFPVVSSVIHRHHRRQDRKSVV